MENRNNVNGLNPEILEEIAKMKEMMENAKEHPSEKCINHEEHNFSFIAAADKREEAIYYFQCENCEEVVIQKQTRASNDPMRHINL